MKNFKNISKLLLVSLIAIAITACSKDDDAATDGADPNGSAPKCELDLSKLTKDAVTLLDATSADAKGVVATLFGSDKLFAETQKEGCNKIFAEGKVPAKLKIEVKGLKVDQAAAGTAITATKSLFNLKIFGKAVAVTSVAGTGSVAPALTATLAAKTAATEIVKVEHADKAADDANNTKLKTLALSFNMSVEKEAADDKIILTGKSGTTDVEAKEAIASITTDDQITLTGSAADSGAKISAGTISFSVVE